MIKKARHPIHAKKIFNGQSLVNPRSHAGMPPATSSVSYFAAPRRQKSPYNAALNGPAISPYRDQSQPEACVTANHADACKPLQYNPYIFLFIACVSCCNKRLSKIHRGQ